MTEEELERLAKELEFYQELGVVDPSFKPFVANKSRNMLRTMTSDPDWPNAGSVKLNGKTATETNNYGEWEIELSVEAKDVDTSKTTNIVLLLDRSGSMQRKPFNKELKKAANTICQ